MKPVERATLHQCRCSVTHTKSQLGTYNSTKHQAFIFLVNYWCGQGSLFSGQCHLSIHKYSLLPNLDAVPGICGYTHE